MEYFIKKMDQISALVTVMQTGLEIYQTESQLLVTYGTHHSQRREYGGSRPALDTRATRKVSISSQITPECSFHISCGLTRV